MEMLSLRNIRKSYGEHVIFDDVTLTLETGQQYAIVGESGSGKSTLLNIMGLLDRPEDGEVSYFGKPVTDTHGSQARHLLREEIGYLFQNYALIEDETVSQNIEVGLKYRKDLRTRASKREEVKHLLAKVHLEGMENRKVFSLSGGEQQRVALARVLGKPCSILFADEPTGNLDEGNGRMVLNLLLQETKKEKTLVLVTHDRSLLPAFDHILSIEPPRLRSFSMGTSMDERSWAFSATKPPDDWESRAIDAMSSDQTENV